MRNRNRKFFTAITFKVNGKICRIDVYRVKRNIPEFLVKARCKNQPSGQKSLTIGIIKCLCNLGHISSDQQPERDFVLNVV